MGVYAGQSRVRRAQHVTAESAAYALAAPRSAPRRTALLAATLLPTLAATLLTLTPTASPPANAATACPGSAATQLEVDRLFVGMPAYKVMLIIGSAGVFDAEASTPTRVVRQWVYCYPDGTLMGRQGVAFERAPAGNWVVQEIA